MLEQLMAKGHFDSDYKVSRTFREEKYRLLLMQTGLTSNLCLILTQIKF
jgi:hypothetical protein